MYATDKCWGSSLFVPVSPFTGGGGCHVMGAVICRGLGKRGGVTLNGHDPNRVGGLAPGIYTCI